MDTSNYTATYVIIGGGIAGVTCVESLAILHPEETAVLVTASSLVKNVSNVSYFAKTIIKFDVEETEASALSRIHPNLNIIYDSLKHLESSTKTIITCTNRRIKYKYLCVCTGGVPKLISDAKHCPRILGIRDTDSVKDFQQRLEHGRRMIIIGNGGIASEIVHATHNIEKIWVIKDDYISSTFIDPGASQFFEDTFNTTTAIEKPTILRRQMYSEEDKVLSTVANMKSAALGPDWIKKLNSSTGASNDTLKIYYKTEIVEVVETNNDYPLQVKLKNGDTIECDFIVSATGVDPAVNFTTDAQFEIIKDGGIAVTELQETSIPDVYAAGDVCSAKWTPSEHWFQMRLWTQARQMGSMAAKAMHGKETDEPQLQDFCFELFTHATTLYGYQVVLLGKYNGQGFGRDYEILLRTTPKLEYIKLVLKNDRLQGAILIGDTGLEEMCENLILNQIDLSPFGDDLLNPDIEIDDYFD